MTVFPVDMVVRDGGRGVAIHRLAEDIGGPMLLLCYLRPALAYLTRTQSRHWLGVRHCLPPIDLAMDNRLLWPKRSGQASDALRMIWVRRLM